MTSVVDLNFFYIYDGLPDHTNGALDTVPSWKFKHNKTFHTPMSVADAYLSSDGATVIFNNVQLENHRELNACLNHVQMMVMKVIYCINANGHLNDPNNIGQIISIYQSKFMKF